MSSLLAGLLAALAAPAQDQDAILPPPPPIHVNRVERAARFALGFKLHDEGDARLRVTFTESSADKAEAKGEKCVLGLDFEPFEGVRWSWSRVADGTPLASALLTNVPEPRGLAFELQIAFPGDHGIEITLADGSPVLVATTPSAAKLDVAFESDGGVLGLTVGALEAIGSTLGAAATKAKSATQPPTREGAWSRVQLTPGETEEIAGVHPLDSMSAPEGAIERLNLEPLETVQAPVVVLRPLVDGPLVATLLVAGGPLGKAHPDALARAVLLAQDKRLVVLMDLFGRGERSKMTPYDSLNHYELELVGSSACEFAAREIRTVLNWLRARADVDPERTELIVDGEAAESLAVAKAGTNLPVSFERRASPSETLIRAATFGEDNVRPRYDSYLQEQVFALRELLAPPDRTLPWDTRLGMTPAASGTAAPMNFDSIWRWSTTSHGGVAKRIEALGPGRSAQHVCLCASDLGVLAAIDSALRTNPADADELIVGLDDGPLGIDPLDPNGGLTLRVNHAVRALEAVDRLGSRRVRLFGEGSCGVVMLLAATLHPELVESVTALHSIPSFTTLIERPQEAPRAPASLGVLTQGMPAELFVENALSRFDLEDCVLELRKHGVKVDWREPVDALRRPLTRHARFAMWPRVRHLEAAR